MSPNLASSKFILTMVCVVSAVALASFGLEVPSGVLVAAIAAYNGANAAIKWRQNGQGDGQV